MSSKSKKQLSPRIAIAGATGRVGAALVAHLQNDPVDVVALSRSPDKAQVPDGVSLAAVDFGRPSSLLDALSGVDRLFLAHGTSAQQVENEIALIDAAVAAGVSHIVKLSVMGPASKLHPFDWHLEIEAHLARQDIGYTLLRPSSFVDILARAGAPVAQASWGGAAGDGRVNLIDTRDVADVARVALLDTAFTNSQRAYHLTGPSTVSMPEVADELSRLLGKTVTYHRRAPEEQREVLITSGASGLVADVLLGIDRLFRESVLAETTSTFTDLTGKAPRSVAVWLSENIAAFQNQ
ncbi:NAD(P)H-binding protein (plasmid) [Agrobacterium tumefaciens]|uniref:NAD(P)H-binding protein n=1 Tax=Agrobacterium tumefaciens TaxID=358 RepID=UPI0015717820|nr:NmrA family NAD(P)-binding protein [Agrobacterium tumefaciens]NSZ66543.1 NAD(P)H-binding protein [Agrobacterium tumefaciens]NTA72915.1 NAD(P)H-binding protein [Agrobacterium tumefaciens]WIE41463.1 NAD(P)H-binding protein [Agrobacterium tumefaciens]